MKAASLVFLALLLPGCLLDVLVTSAVSADLAAQEASATMETMEQAELDTDLLRLREAIKYYNVEKEGYPRELSELVPDYIEAIPTRKDGSSFGYNPVTGEVFESGAGPAPADYLMMASLEQAIVAYGTQTGYYPPTLESLYPTYVQSPPRTASGQPFGYDNQTGRITHPDAGKEPVRTVTDPMPASEPVPASKAIGSLKKGDLKDSNSLNKALDRIGY